MKNRIRFEDLTHFIFMFLMFLTFTTIFLSWKNLEEERGVGENEEVISESFSETFLQGRNLFKTNCGSCHAKDMRSVLTGPALGKVKERWEGKEKELYGWIRNSQKYLIENPNDKYAHQLYKKYGENVMTPFPNLTDNEIENILEYIETVYKK